jgi:response regulator receiver domain
MHIDYKIIWLDDNIQVFENDEHIDNIKEYLIEKGFNPIIDIYSKQQNFLNDLNDTYDLILTDYHMDGMNGDEVIEKIRKDKGIFTEILFYTARANLKDTDKIDRITFFQPSNNHYKEVADKIKSLIELTLKKFNDIVIMRGMIMNEVSYMDEVKLDIIKRFINDEENDTSGLKSDILSDIDQQFNTKISKINKWKNGSTGFKELIKDNFVFSSSYKIKTISYILDNMKLENFADGYEKDIIQMRNKFAHVALKEEDGKKYFKSNTDDNIFDDTLCKKIREDIIKYKRYLLDMRDKFEK